MLRKRVYIETTIPSFYYETRVGFEIWSDATRRWWDQARRTCQLFTSQIVIDELSRTPGRKGRLALELMSLVERLEVDPEVISVAEFYMKQKLLPRTARPGDAYHLAVASVRKLDLLLTWNCAHLANPSKAEHLRVLNSQLGLAVPVIPTPMPLVEEH